MRRNCGLLLFRDISGLNETELQDKREAIKRETKDQWNKIEFAIADIIVNFQKNAMIKTQR
jgi:hypothetical protein